MPDPGEPLTIDCTQRLLPLLEELRARRAGERRVARARRGRHPPAKTRAPGRRRSTFACAHAPAGGPARISRLRSTLTWALCSALRMHRILYADPGSLTHEGFMGGLLRRSLGQPAAARDRQLFPARRRCRSIRRENRPRLARGDPARGLERPASRDRRRRPVVRAGAAPVQARAAGGVASRVRASRRTRLGRHAAAVPAGAGAARIAFPRPGGGGARSDPPSRRRPGRRGRRAPPRRAARPVRRLHRVAFAVVRARRASAFRWSCCWRG